MRTPPLTVIARSPCDEAIQGPRAVAPGLLRCARNDGGVDATIIGHHRLCQTTSCRDSIPVSRLFNALQAGKVSLPLFSERRVRRWRRGRLRGETRGFGRTASCRRRSRFFPRFSIYQCFASRKISLPCNNKNFPRNSRAAQPLVSRSARSATRPCTTILWLRGLRDQSNIWASLAGPGLDNIKVGKLLVFGSNPSRPAKSLFSPI
jgi:hypothetical protein